AAAAADPGAHAIERFGGAFLRRADDQGRPVATPDRVIETIDQRMPWHELLIRLNRLERVVLLAIARLPAGISFSQPHFARVELVGTLIALAGVFPVAGKIEDQAGMHVLEQAVPV